MCGFCGVAYADPSRQVDETRLGRMCGTITHRGPDDFGYHFDGPVGLGHQRLSIVDLAHGHQPMCNESGDVWIAFNGEVYNHADFRGELEARGHQYRTRCDTEAIIHLYEEHGPDAVHRLNGMFAFAIWDARRRTLLLARDRVGVKPLFWAQTPAGDIVFGSELKTLFASGLVSPELDESLVPEYLATGHLVGGRTLFHGVQALEPGHTLTWRDGRIQVRRYWSVAELPRPDVDAPLPGAEAFWTRFREAVRKMLMADVPLGVFLSGGLDSSLIVAAMRECGVRDLKSFSVGFNDPEASELPYARVVAQAFGTAHEEVLVEPGEFFGALPQLTWHRDQPLTFSASIPLYFVSRLARESVKVVLTGEGSDELFAGYGRYPRGLANLRGARMLDAALPGPARRGVSALVRAGGDGYVGSRLKRSFLARRGTVEDAYFEPFADFDATYRARLLRAGAGDPYAAVTRLLDPELMRENPLEAMLRLDQVTYLEELLAKQDQMSMAASIESRVPFLDESLVEWAATLPPSAKLRGTVGKAIVRDAALRHLPESIVRDKKRGFPVPIARWLRGPGRHMLEQFLPASGDPLLDASGARALADEHLRGVDHAARLWRLLAFQVWREDTLPRLRALAAAPRVSAAPALS